MIQAEIFSRIAAEAYMIPAEGLVLVEHVPD
jgi:hypothetical protein